MTLVLRRHEPLSQHTALRTGGRCDLWAVAHDREALLSALALCREEELPWTILGAGTRVVVRDGGLSGAIIRLGVGFSNVLRLGEDGQRWRIGAAALASSAVWMTAAAGNTGLEDMFPTPGSFGAAIVHDAEVGKGFATRIIRVGYLHKNKEREGSFEEFRKVQGRTIILYADVQLDLEEPALIRRRLTERWTEIQSRFPSSWMLPPKRSSLRDVLDRAGMRDVRLRDVVIPGVAPELLVNLGGGTARDLALLHQSVIERAAREVGIELQSRVSWMGRA